MDTHSRIQCGASVREAAPVSKPPSSSAIEVEMIQSGEINLPAEFQVALYENLVQEVQKEEASPRSIVTVTAMPSMPPV